MDITSIRSSWTFSQINTWLQVCQTAMCLASEYPEVIPLKDIRAETVAENMMEIFCRLGVPRKLLTDQGSQFAGHLMKELCKKMNNEKIRTSAYHPETNGYLKRWHGTLTPMI